MLLERHNVHLWGWLVYAEMFIAGIAAGAYVAAALLELSGRGRSPAARAAHLIAFPLMLVTTVLLILDLTRPERFWHMVIMSERYLPMIKLWSPMNDGVWLVMLFTGFAFVSFVDAFIARRSFRVPGWRYDRTLHGSPLGLVWSVVGGLLALGVGIYSGVLLSVTNLPGWAHSGLLPAVFAATALITGFAAVVLFQALRGEVDPDTLGLAGANVWLVAFWLVLMVLYLGMLGVVGITSLLSGVAAAALVLAIVLAGVIPLALARIRPLRSGPTLALFAALVLLGGFLFRFAVISGPQHV